MGMMLLVFMPVPYVDASAAGRLPRQVATALVGAAGMLVELVLAALAMYRLGAVEPGLVRAVAFNVMLIAGVSTLIFNGNPLLRFDGYYILADLIEIPNLRAARQPATGATWPSATLRRARRRAPPLLRRASAPGSVLRAASRSSTAWS